MGCSRRDVLRVLGMGAAALPWIPLLPSHAAPGAAPRRLLLVHFAHGVAADRWRPQGTPDAWSLGETLQPLAPYLDRLTQIDGLANAVGREQVGDVHNIALGTLLTATGLAADQGAGGHYLPGGPSIDQRIATAIAARDDAPPHPSLQLGVRTQGFAIAAADRGVPLLADDDPARAYARIFGELALAPEARAAIVAARGDARDFARRRLDAIAQTLGAEDRDVLQRHRAAIDAIESREQTEHPLPSSCALPAVPTAIDRATTPADADVPALVDDTNALVAAAFACDLTRVVTLQWGSSGNDGLRHTWQGIDADYHSVAHLANGEDPVAHEQLATSNRWYVERFAALLDMLDAIDEGDGSALDHTTCVLTSGLSIVHDMGELPLVIVGGGVPGNRWLRTGGASIAGLWRALALHMDVDLGAFGDPDFDEGVLEGVV
jgi:hypothetical protein